MYQAARESRNRPVFERGRLDHGHRIVAELGDDDAMAGHHRRTYLFAAFGFALLDASTIARRYFAIMQDEAYVSLGAMR